MKIALSLLALFSTTTSAFTVCRTNPSTLSVTTSSPSTLQTSSITRLAAGPEEDEEGLDLNLEEMFDMFDAAAKEEDFDDTIKKVKGE
eukprot:CAMPEP_0184858176 /NCGR_PEP_ID=MMETSP0580-20130426/3300_1 /TAXON_ID=1118495 /ORGANISM="Dactyliosolen fragilissimus" /LENGTH=87 /DNA_ID=CAMNT_0027354179 /DNA_START=38 /DNA_END=301 /DNA_ORIENTATION=-